MHRDDDSKTLELLYQIADAIAELFGSDCEVCISDIDQPEEAVLYIRNGHVTGRSVGSPLLEEARLRVQQTGEETHLNYKKILHRTGRTLKSSTVVRRIDGRNISFCINYDCAHLESAQYFLNKFLDTPTKYDELDVLGVNSPSAVKSIIESAILDMDRPVESFDKADRLKVVKDLDNKGILHIQNSVRLISEALGVSRYSIYNYIKEIRNTDDPPSD